MPVKKEVNEKNEKKAKIMVYISLDLANELKKIALQLSIKNNKFIKVNDLTSKAIATFVEKYKKSQKK